MSKLLEKIYPKHPVLEMGKITQNAYGIKWVKKERRFGQWGNEGCVGRG
jgi:hypothetical protein